MNMITGFCNSKTPSDFFRCTKSPPPRLGPKQQLLLVVANPALLLALFLVALEVCLWDGSRAFNLLPSWPPRCHPCLLFLATVLLVFYGQF